MTLAYWCVLIAALLPYLWVVMAKTAPGFSNRAPRAFLEKVSGWHQRALWAQYNAFEAPPLFIAGVIIAHQLNVPQGRIDGLAAAFISFRLAHGVFYLMDWAAARSLAWIAAFACAVALFVSAANA